MSRIYISGKITGLTQTDATRRFANAESLLKEIGFDVVNPLKNGLAWDAAWDEHMVRDIKLLFSCEAIYMMEAWLDSTGAQIEYDIATRLRKAISFEGAIQRESPIILRIKSAIHAVTGLHFAAYATKSRQTILFYARMMFAHHARKYHMTLVDIGRLLHRDHSSILYLINKYENDRDFDPAFRPLALKVEAIIGEHRDPFSPKSAKRTGKKLTKNKIKR